MNTGRFFKIFGLVAALTFLILALGSNGQAGLADGDQLACTASHSRDNSTHSAIHTTATGLVTRVERPTVWIVCPTGCQFSRIQAAIDFAKPGDFLLVGPGTYQENLTINKSLTVQGVRPALTMITGTEKGAPLIRLESDEEIQVAIENLALRSNKQCSGIEIFGDKMTVSLAKVEISDNRLTGPSVSGLARVRILNTSIRGNRQWGIFARLSNIEECRGNTVVDNGTNFSSPELEKQCS